MSSHEPSSDDESRKFEILQGIQFIPQQLIMDHMREGDFTELQDLINEINVQGRDRQFDFFFSHIVQQGERPFTYLLFNRIFDVERGSYDLKFAKVKINRCLATVKRYCRPQIFLQALRECLDPSAVMSVGHTNQYRVCLFIYTPNEPSESQRQEIDQLELSEDYTELFQIIQHYIQLAGGALRF